MRNPVDGPGLSSSNYSFSVQSERQGIILKKLDRADTTYQWIQFLRGVIQTCRSRSNLREVDLYDDVTSFNQNFEDPTLFKKDVEKSKTLIRSLLSFLTVVY